MYVINYLLPIRIIYAVMKAIVMRVIISLVVELTVAVTTTIVEVSTIPWLDHHQRYQLQMHVILLWWWLMMIIILIILLQMKISPMPSTHCAFLMGCMNRIMLLNMSTHWATHPKLLLLTHYTAAWLPHWHLRYLFIHYSPHLSRMN